MTGCPFSIFLIEAALETLGAKQETFRPRWGSFHLLTNDRKGDLLVAFDDEFIMDVCNNIHAPQRLHGIAENVATDRLRDILHELRTVGFNPRSLFREIESHVSDGFAAERILSDARFYVGKPSAARKFDEHHTALIDESDAVRDLCAAFLDAVLCGSVDCPPELYDVRICSTPSIHERFQFIFLHPGFQCAERF